MPIETKKFSLDPLPRMRYWPALACAAVSLSACAGTALWRFFDTRSLGVQLRLFGFASAWMPFVLTLIVAFIPDREHHLRAHMKWRFAIAIGGFATSLIMWHQQSLQIATESVEQREAVASAVSQANIHSDSRIADAQRTITANTDQRIADVRGDLQNSDQRIATILSAEQANLDANIAKVGKPGAPPVAVLTFTLWSDNTAARVPTLIERLSPNKHGVFTIPFTLFNSSKATAEGIDVWVNICEACSFASEPAGMDRPNGMGKRERHFKFSSLNPGVSMDKHEVAIKFHAQTAGFTIVVRYSCRDCGGKVSPPQTATILVGSPATADHLHLHG